MLRILAAAILLGLFAVACSDVEEGDSDEQDADSTSTPASGETSEPNGTETPDDDEPGPPEHEGDRAMDHIEALAGDLGVRVSGTPEEAEAVDYIEGQFESFGYDVEVMEFEYDSERRFAAVDVDGGEELLGLAFEGSPNGSASGPAVYVGLASEDDVAEAEDLNGAVAVAMRGTVTFEEKYENVLAAGAVALVVINNEDEFLAGSLGLEGEIPVASLDPGAGEFALIATANGTELTVSIASQEGMNVIARPPGTNSCAIIVGGHHDTVPAAPGAHDNASGTANVLELARAFAVDGFDEGLCFVTFGAEESGLNGSRALAEQLAGDDDLPDFMVNLDVTGIGQPIDIIGDSDMQDRALDVAASLGIEAERSTEPADASSDHASFAELGVPVVFFASSDFDVIHTANDVVDNIEVETLDQAGDIAYGVIVGLLEEVGG